LIAAIEGADVADDDMASIVVGNLAVVLGPQHPRALLPQGDAILIADAGVEGHHTVHALGQLDSSDAPIRPLRGTDDAHPIVHEEIAHDGDVATDFDEEPAVLVPLEDALGNEHVANMDVEP
jgi:hypothetical protein